MKNKVFISIIDEKGSRQFKIHKIIKRVFAYGILGIFLLMVGGFFLMNFLMKQVQEIDRIKTEMIGKYQQAHLQNQAIRNQIQEKTNELLEMSQKVEALEEIVDFSKNVDNPKKKISENLGMQDRIFLLQIIPNGHPLKSFNKITSIKERLHPLKNKYGINTGVDYWVNAGSPVYATADGIVELARKRTSAKGYGRFVKITHAYGFSSMYGHLLEVLVKKGDFVKKGQMIGYSGRSGESAGERLYYEVRILGSYQNALAFAQWGKKNFDYLFIQVPNIDWDHLFWAVDDLRELQKLRQNSGEI